MLRPLLNVALSAQLQINRAMHDQHRQTDDPGQQTRMD